MKELLGIFEESVQSRGHQCITVSSIEDFYNKLHCMGGSYKGFIMSDKLDSFCMLYVDTEKMRNSDFIVRGMHELRRYNLSSTDRIFLSRQPEQYVVRFLSGSNQHSFLDTFYNDYIPPRKKRRGIRRWLFGE